MSLLVQKSNCNSYLLPPGCRLEKKQFTQDRQQDETCFWPFTADLVMCPQPNNIPATCLYFLLWLHKLLHALVFPSQLYFIPKSPAFSLHPHHYRNQNSNPPFILIPKSLCHTHFSSWDILLPSPQIALLVLFLPSKKEMLPLFTQ